MVRRQGSLAAAVLLGLSVPAGAGDLVVTLTTLFRPYDYVDLTGEVVRFSALSPAVVVSASEILGRDLSFAANARSVDDLEARGGDGHNDLLYAVVTWRDPTGKALFSGGRQVQAHGPGYITFDGLRGEYRVGGLELGGSAGFGFERDGRKVAAGRYGSAVLRWNAGHWGSLGATVERGSDDGLKLLAKEALDGVFRPTQRMVFRGSFIWNRAVGEMDEATGQLDLRLAAGRLLAEMARIEPHFDPTTIWNVFNTGPYDRFAVRFQHPLGESGDVWARVERRLYHGRRGAGLGLVEPGFRSVADSVSVGFGSSPEASLAYAVELFFHNGFGGLRTGASLRVGHELGFLPGSASVGLDLRAYNRGIRDSRQDLSTAIWGELVLRLGESARLRLKGEDYRNGFIEDDVRFTLKLDISTAEAF